MGEKRPYKQPNFTIQGTRKRTKAQKSTCNMI